MSEEPSDFEIFTVNRIRREVIEGIDDPEERLRELLKLKRQITSRPLMKWKDAAIKAIEAGIEEAKYELNNKEDKTGIHYNPAALLKLFDYTDKGEEPLSIQEKIDLLQKTLRYLSRKDFSSAKERDRADRAIRNYKIELDYLKTLKNTNRTIQDVISNAIKPLRKTNKEKARDFMAAYNEIKSLNPGLSISQYIKEIGWASPSSVTQRDWIEKFEEAKKDTLKSNQ